MKLLLNSFNRFVRFHSLLDPGDRVLTAVSGGPDSVALLRVLAKVREKYRLKIFVAHMNHGLRGRRSDRDERFVREMCAGLGLPVSTKKVRVAEFGRKKGLSLEEASRICRYRFLVETARHAHANKIATAHTLDDQAETVLMRIIRGAGLKGLAAIPAKRAEDGIMLIRPLLGVAKDEILSFLKKEKIPFRTDASNRDPRHLRNRLRRELMPLLVTRYNPQFRKNLVELASISGEIYDFIRQHARSLYFKISRRGNGRVRLALPRLKKLPAALRVEIYFLAAEHLAGNRRRITRHHVEGVEALVEAPPGTSQHLPKGLCALKTRDAIVFTRKRPKTY